jgi:hypothetical protein
VQADPAVPPARAVERFLSRYRGRLLLRSLLANAGVAFVLNEAVRWTSAVLEERTGAEVTIMNMGPLYLLAVWFVLARRWHPARVAAAADRRLALKDRLLSFLDFAARPAVPEALRQAQAAEAAAALAARGRGALAAVPPLLWAGPLLLLASVAYPLFLPMGSTTVTYFREEREGGRPRPGGKDAPRDAGDAAKKGDDAAKQERRTPPPEVAGQDAAPRTPAAANDPAARQPPERRHARGIVPERPLVSTRTGAALTKVVDPLLRETVAERPQPAPSGTFSFRLLPRTAKGGAGEGGQGGENPEQVVVDFDAIPEGYRALVQRYFTLLGRRDAPRPEAPEKEPS